MGVFTTAATTWSVGTKITAAQLNGQVRDFINGFGAFTAYTPTLTGFTPGNGTATGAYLQVQKLVMVRIKFVFGTTSAAAAAAPVLTLPVTASSSFGTIPGVHVGHGTFVDTGAATYQAIVRLESTTTVGLYIPGTSGLRTAPSTTTPFTWANTDEIHAVLFYEAA